MGWAGQFRPQTPGQHGKGGDDNKRGIKCGALHSLQSKIVIPSVSRGIPLKLPLRFRGGILDWARDDRRKSARVIGNWQSAFANLFSGHADTRYRGRRIHWVA